MNIIGIGKWSEILIIENMQISKYTLVFSPSVL